jgi:hypothetical protein
MDQHTRSSNFFSVLLQNVNKLDIVEGIDERLWLCQRVKHLTSQCVLFSNFFKVFEQCGISFG